MEKGKQNNAKPGLKSQIFITAGQRPADEQKSTAFQAAFSVAQQPQVVDLRLRKSSLSG